MNTEADKERPLPSASVASSLGCTLQYLLRRANEARIKNWCGGVRVWFKSDVDAIRPLIRKAPKLEDASKAAKASMEGWVK